MRRYGETTIFLLKLKFWRLARVKRFTIIVVCIREIESGRVGCCFPGRGFGYDFGSGFVLYRGHGVNESNFGHGNKARIELQTSVHDTPEKKLEILCLFSSLSRTLSSSPVSNFSNNITFAWLDFWYSLYKARLRDASVMVELSRVRAGNT